LRQATQQQTVLDPGDDTRSSLGFGFRSEEQAFHSCVLPVSSAVAAATVESAATMESAAAVKAAAVEASAVEASAVKAAAVKSSAVEAVAAESTTVAAEKPSTVIVGIIAVTKTIGVIIRIIRVWVIVRISIRINIEPRMVPGVSCWSAGRDHETC
jgi:hypothetical protein